MSLLKLAGIKEQALKELKTLYKEERELEALKRIIEPFAKAIKKGKRAIEDLAIERGKIDKNYIVSSRIHKNALKRLSGQKASSSVFGELSEPFGNPWINRLLFGRAVPKLEQMHYLVQNPKYYKEKIVDTLTAGGVIGGSLIGAGSTYPFSNENKKPYILGGATGGAITGGLTSRYLGNILAKKILGRFI